jgi:serine/threonine protein kinase
MERTIFLQHYRIRVGSDGNPYEIERNGSTTYEAVDERTGEPVSLKLISTESIGTALREQFQEHAFAAQKLRHVNVAKVLDFGREGDDFVYVSEYLPGEALAAWVRSHGPMPVDAALRVAEQIVSVLSSASFHRLPLPPIEPSDIIVVPGQTPEGTWPLVKLTNFGLPPLTLRTEVQPAHSVTPDQALSTEQVASSEKPAHATDDIRSEISSLGATLYFLLTGTALSAEALQRGPKLSRFPKPLRTLLGRMLHSDPNQRPKDLIVLAEMIRQCLLKLERRRQFADKYGLPFRRTIRPSVEVRSARLLRGAVAVAVLLLAAAVMAPVLFPQTIGRIMHRSRDTKNIGVLVGVPQSSLRPANQITSSTLASTPVASQGTNTSAPLPGESPVNAAMASNSSQAAPSTDLQPRTLSEQTSAAQTQTAAPNAQPQPAAPSGSETTSPAQIAESSSSSTGETKSPSTSSEAQQPTTSDQSSSQGKKPVASASRRGRGSQAAPEDSTQRRVRSVRARVVGITSDGRLILRLPSGRTAFVAPDSDQEQSMPRRHRRNFIGRDEMFARPPQFEPDYFPND